MSAVDGQQVGAIREDPRDEDAIRRRHLEVLVGEPTGQRGDLPRRSGQARDPGKDRERIGRLEISHDRRLRVFAEKV